MVDMSAFKPRSWPSWKVFAVVTIVSLAALLVLVHRGNVGAMRVGDAFLAALYGAVAVAGLGFQEARALGAYRRRWWFPSDSER